MAYDLGGAGIFTDDQDFLTDMFAEEGDISNKPIETFQTKVFKTGLGKFRNLADEHDLPPLIRNLEDFAGLKNQVTPFKKPKIANRGELVT
jgi:hypothetical protein